MVDRRIDRQKNVQLTSEFVPPIYAVHKSSVLNSLMIYNNTPAGKEYFLKPLSLSEKYNLTSNLAKQSTLKT